MKWAWCCIVLVLAACVPQAAPQLSPTAAVGEVMIAVPAEGTVYYGNLVTVRGTARDLPPDGFDLRLLLNEESLAQVRVVPIDGQWSALIPVDARAVGVLTVQAESISVERVYATAMAVKGQAQDRPPAEVYGLIFSPAPDDVMGGEQIVVRGVASGVGEGALTLTLTDERGREVQQVRVLMPTLEPLDEVPFQAEMLTGNGAGRYTLTLRFEGQALDEVTFFLGEIAG